MENKLYDCAIIGGGLAGLSLSIQLARCGHQVILFEKSQYPFQRVCGEYISKESLDFLVRLGIPFSEISIAHIDEVLISAPNGSFIKRPLSLGGIGISRYLLDHHLYQLAVQSGVTVLQNTKVENIQFENSIFQITTEDTSYRAKLACGTFGKKSVLDKKIREENPIATSDYVGIKYHVRTSLVPNRIELHNFADGYCGISKIEDDKYCMCYLTHSKNLKKYKGNIKQMEAEVLYKNPYLKKYFTESEFLFDQPLSISQVSFSKKNTVEQNILLLGDAAGTIAPLCGNGMSMALHASHLAAGLINLYLNKHIDFETLKAQYSKAWNEQFSLRIKIGANLQKVFGKNTLTNLTIGLLSHLPKAVDGLIGLTHGKKY